jgi:hypothetical protein
MDTPANTAQPTTPPPAYEMAGRGGAAATPPVETEECEWRPDGDAASLLSDEIGQAQGQEMGIKVYP